MSSNKLTPQAWQEYQAVYVHIPFCLQKCLYCDFASYAGCTQEQMEAYTDALCHEIAARVAEAAHTSATATVYFGGGTPSVLPTACLERIVHALKSAGFWNLPAEATIEVNPGTASLAKLQALRSLGFDRLSLGVQSLQDAELRTIGRIHTAAQALEALDWACAAGFARVSADLMYGLPAQSLASLRTTLEQLTATGVEHLSVYGLIVEEGTPLERLLAEGRLTLPDEDTTADMYELVQCFLWQAGFARYEISNYAKNNQYSRHNTVYWQYHPYVAFGAAACGFDGQQRRTATSSVQDYTQQAALLTPASWQTSSLYNIEALSAAEQLEEFMFMGLRRSEGASLAEAQERFGVDVLQRFGAELEPCFAQGLLALDDRRQQLRLTERGMAVGNQVFEIFVTG